MRSPLLLIVAASAVLALGACSCPTVVADKPTPRPTDDLITDVVPTDAPSGDPLTDLTDDTPGYRWIYDSTKHVSVSVPDSWTDVEGAGYVDDDGANWYRVSASPDLNAYHTEWETPGVDVAATAFPEKYDVQEADSTDKQLFAALNETSGFDQSCTTDQVNVPYGDTTNWYKGYLSTWNDCAGTSTSALLMSMYDTKLTHFIFVIALLTTDKEKDEVCQEILASYQAKFDDKAYVPRD